MRALKTLDFYKAPWVRVPCSPPKNKETIIEMVSLFFCTKAQDENPKGRDRERESPMDF
ncbi:MAG: hypothetical protein K0R55_2082 [Sporomusa sp.]|nr:hypothetical protein [Sporomusa sp.]